MGSTEFSKKIAKGAGIVFLGMVFSKLFSYLYVMLVARIGSSDYGLISLGFAIISFITTISLLGLGIGIIRYVAYYKGKNDKARIKGAILSSIGICLPFGVGLACLLFIFSKQISLGLFHSLELVPILRIFSLLIPFLVLSDIFLGTMRAFQRIGYVVGIKEVSEKFIRLFLTLILIYFGYGLFGVVVAYVVSVSFTFILSFYFLERKVFSVFKKDISPIFYKKELLFYSLPLLFTGFLTMIMKWTDTVMLGYFRTTSEVGIYNVALPTANLLVLVPTALMALFLPIITELYSKDKLGNIKDLCRRTSKWIFFINFPIFLLIIFFSKAILRVMFGQEYVVGYVALSLLSFGYIIHSLSHVNSTVLLTIKKTKLILIIGLFSAVLNVILNYFLIPEYGIIGAAIATSISLISLFCLYFFFNYLIMGIQPLMLSYLKALFSGLISVFLVYYLTKFLFRTVSFFNLILMFILFLLIYLILLILFRSFDKEDINVLKTFKLKLISLTKK